jgi:hypothetical protein
LDCSEIDGDNDDDRSPEFEDVLPSGADPMKSKAVRIEAERRSICTSGADPMKSKAVRIGAELRSICTSGAGGLES